MNIFRLTGDLSHLAAIVILLLKIWKTRSCAGERGRPAARGPTRARLGRLARTDRPGPHDTPPGPAQDGREKFLLPRSLAFPWVLGVGGNRPGLTWQPRGPPLA